MANTEIFDAVIVGSGAAGLTTALRLAAKGRIAIVSKSTLTDSSTFYAQGGIAAVLSETDTIESHIEDTLNAGAGLCDRQAVAATVENSAAAIQWLIDEGVSFSLDSADQTRYHLTQEGGHSQRRIIHAADATGRAVETTLVQAVKKQASITLFEHHNAVDLIKHEHENRCIGLHVLDCKSGAVKTFRAKFFILATGGASKVYLYTSNPDVASGDGIAMAWRAGCRVANMEFNQFHPTCLYHPKANSFLISEALRGEGAILKRPDGEPFMANYAEQKELAPRDIVARAIDAESKRLGVRCMYLDISHRPADFIKSHFPTIYEKCLSLGIDITQQAIPVVPAAHYSCGGVMVNLESRSDVDNLYVIGEASHTGLHGANRMASNSLLECLVFARSAAESIIKHWDDFPIPDQTRPWDASQVTDSDEEIVVTHNWHELRRAMWDYVGIVRTNKRLQRAQNRISLLTQEIQEYYRHFHVTNDLLELRNLVVVADLIVKSAMKRKESRGLHFSLDFPETLPKAENTVLTPTNCAR